MNYIDYIIYNKTPLSNVQNHTIFTQYPKGDPMSDNNYPKISADETFRETIDHGSSEYPFGYYYEDIWEFELHTIDWHWHSEVEFILVEKGTAHLLAGSRRYTIREGEGVFINSRIIHRLECDGSTIIPNMVFSPALLAPEGSLIFNRYVEAVINSAEECIVFSKENSSGEKGITLLKKVFALQREKDNEMETVSTLLELWKLIYEISDLTGRTSIPGTTSLARSRLQMIMQYIHNNYAEQITLDELAAIVSLSKSSVLELFKQYLHTSPINYLIEYRLKCAGRLLKDTEMSVSAIAADTGFDNIGYFCRRFKDLFGTTPTKYRKQYH